MSRNIVIYPNRGLTGATEQPFITFSGLTAGSISLVVEDDGSITFDGDTGSLFGITDNKDGLLHSVNDVSGLPIFQVYADDKIIMGKWDDPAMTLTSGGTININLDNVGGGTPIFNLGVDSSGDVVTGTTGGGSFTGNTSGSCITDLYVSNVYGCSPVTFYNSIISDSTDISSYFSTNMSDSIIFGNNIIITGTSGDIYQNIVTGNNHKLTDNTQFIWNSSIIGGDSNEIGGRAAQIGIYTSSDSFGTGTNSSIVGGSNHYVSGLDMLIAGGREHYISSSPYSSIVGGYLSVINTGGDGDTILGGLSNRIQGFGTNVRNSSIIGGSYNVLSATSVDLENTVIIGGTGITGTTSNTVYTPNLVSRGNIVIHSDELSLEPSVYDNTIFKGGVILFSHTGTTINAIINNTTSGVSQTTVGNSSGGANMDIAYYNNGYLRSALTPTNGREFYRNKGVINLGNSCDGLIISLDAGANNSRLWFEENAESGMLIAGRGGFNELSLGIGLNADGTEIPTAHLQVGGTGTTGTFRFIDGNQDVGYVMTSDVSGNVSWAAPTGGGGSYLPLTGGTMTGNITMGSNTLINGTTSFYLGQSPYGYGVIETPNDSGSYLLYNNVSGTTGRITRDVLTTDRTWTFPDNSGTIALTSDIPSGSEATTATTTTIDFTAPKIFYKYTNQATGDILEDLTGAKLGITQKIYHNDSVEPAYPAGWVLMGDGVYFTSQLNIIYCEWAEGARVEYWYVQEQ